MPEPPSLCGSRCARGVAGLEEQSSLSLPGWPGLWLSAGQSMAQVLSCSHPSHIHACPPAWFWHRQSGLSWAVWGQAQTRDNSQGAGWKSSCVLWKREFGCADTNCVTAVVLRDRERSMSFYLLFILHSKSSHLSRTLSSHTSPVLTRRVHRWTAGPRPGKR